MLQDRVYDCRLVGLSHLCSIALLWLLAGLCLWQAGCGHGPPAMPAPPPPAVEVTLPSFQTITDYEDFTGQTEAVKTIDIRARVTGYRVASFLGKSSRTMTSPWSSTSPVGTNPSRW